VKCPSSTAVSRAAHVARHSAEGREDLRAMDPVTEATGYPPFSAIFIGKIWENDGK